MRLLETQRNDIPGLTDARVPTYGMNGRPLLANERNSLTKACVATIGDFNDNGTSDISEIQLPVVGTDDRARLNSFSFFLELYTSFYEPPVSGMGPGTLVIRERSRCNLADLPLRYDFTVTDPAVLTDGYSGASGAPVGGALSTYWRSCARRRDAAFNSSTPVPGMDFAQWTCPGTTGSCPAAPPAHPTLIPPTDPKATLLRNHGVCELGGAKPADMVCGKWLSNSVRACSNSPSTVSTWPVT